VKRSKNFKNALWGEMKFLVFLLSFLICLISINPGYLLSHEIYTSTSGFLYRDYEIEIKVNDSLTQIETHCIIKGIKQKETKHIIFQLNHLLTVEKIELNGDETVPAVKKIDNNNLYTIQVNSISGNDIQFQIWYKGELEISKIDSKNFLMLISPYKWYPDFMDNMRFDFELTGKFPQGFQFISQGIKISERNSSSTYKCEQAKRIAAILLRDYKEIIRNFDEGSIFRMYYADLKSLNAHNLAETIMWQFGHFTEKLGKFRTGKPVTCVCAPAVNDFIVEEPTFFIIPESEVSEDFQTWKKFNDFFHETGFQIARYWWESVYSTWIEKGLSRYSAFHASVRYFGPDEEKRLTEIYHNNAHKIDYSMYTNSVFSLHNSDLFYNAKFPLILRLLENYMGVKNFEIFYQTIINERGKEISLNKMINFASEAQGEDLEWFFLEWFDNLSIPKLKMDYQITKLLGSKHRITLSVEQSGNHVYRFPLIVKIITEEGNILRKYFINKKTYRFSESFFRKPLDVIFDQENFVLKETL